MSTTATTVGSLPRYDFARVLDDSLRANWRLEDVASTGVALDFAKPFLPESLSQTERLDFLAPKERLALNHVRSNAYLAIFGLVEEFILPFILDHARPSLSDDDARTRALLQFAGEEAKHIALFRGFAGEFERGFGSRCGVIGPAADIGKAVLAHDPLGVALAILQIEWMTQRHWLEAARDDGALDPRFKGLLRFHWAEESQHAKLDTLMVEALAAGRSKEEIARGFDAYLAIGAFIDGGLAAQVELDLASFELATGRTLDAAERARFLDEQRRANRFTYLVSGMTHPRFRATVESLGGDLLARLDQAIESLS
ncbi:MAG TPA: hypothetical protein VKE69_05645 [Planctomycetota bacterium]|nr:hypothetical protein [Planctomycetota bacterium]